MANIPLCNHFQPSVMVVATERNPVSDVNDKISIVHQSTAFLCHKPDINGTHSLEADLWYDAVNHWGERGQVLH